MYVSPEFYINALRLLLEGYKVAQGKFKDKKTPEQVEDILTQAEESPSSASEEIERRIDKLDPGDAAIVNRDLQLMRLLVLPAPELNAFDYWGKLTQLVQGLQAYALSNRLFELRGVNKGLGEVLYLPKSGDCILPGRASSKLPISYQTERLSDTSCSALLRKETSAFPIILLVVAEFNHYSSMGDTSVVSDACYFEIIQGQQRHWLRFDRGQRHSPHFHQYYEYMLEAADLISIVEALRDDILNCAIEVQADEQKIKPLFSSIEGFSKGLTGR